jgi:hypothetical protein
MKPVEFSLVDDYGYEMRLILLRFRGFSVLEIWGSQSLGPRLLPDFRLTIEILTHNLISLGVSAWGISFQIKILSFYRTFELYADQ